MAGPRFNSLVRDAARSARAIMMTAALRLRGWDTYGGFMRRVAGLFAGLLVLVLPHEQQPVCFKSWGTDIGWSWMRTAVKMEECGQG